MSIEHNKNEVSTDTVAMLQLHHNPALQLQVEQWQ